MKYPKFVAALACLLVVVFASAAHAANTYKANPAGVAYRWTPGASAYGKPGGMLIVGNCNYDEQVFKTARANGAEIIRYIAPVNFITRYICPEDSDFYGNLSTTPRWPYPSPGARTNYPQTLMTDIRKGSQWSNRVVAYVERMMREDKVDGVFLDVVGARLWTSLANWESWPQWERDAWTDGNIDLVRRLDASRKAINPKFIIVNNGMWDRGDSRGLVAEKYVDGVIFEHHASSSTWHRNVAKRSFGTLGHRRVIAFGKSVADAQAWANVQGITHVSSNQLYFQVTPPPIAFTRLTDRPQLIGRGSTSAVNWSPGMANNYRRGSKFWLNEKGTLLNMGAFIDGRGGPSGGQNLRMVVYQDNGGRPGTKVAESNARSISAGNSQTWVYFPASAVRMNPGAYWVMLHSGAANAVGRIASGGNANWYGSGDMYTDGAANPAGAGSSGTTTANVVLKYTRGH